MHNIVTVIKTGSHRANWTELNFVQNCDLQISSCNVNVFNTSRSSSRWCSQSVLRPRLHDTTGCQAGWTTGMTTGWMFLYDAASCSRLHVWTTWMVGCWVAWIRPVEFIQPVGQPAECSYTQYNRLSFYGNQLDNRLYRVNGVQVCHTIFNEIVQIK